MLCVARCLFSVRPVLWTSCFKTVWRAAPSRSYWGLGVSRAPHSGVVFRCSCVKMSNQAADMELSSLRKSVEEQAEVVRRLKNEGHPNSEIQASVAELKARKKALEQCEAELKPPAEKFDRSGLENLLKRRFFYTQSFAIYGGVSGLYDYGPLGSAMKSQLISLWRSHFVLEENLSEVDCVILTPEPVLKASGHMERFSDLMVKDMKTGECFRADHLLKDRLDKLTSDPKCTPEQAKEYADVITKIDNYSQSELEQLFERYSVKSPVTGNDLSAPVQFNLMFCTSIGPEGNMRGSLRPETSQGIFVNFKPLLECSNGKLPFGVAQIGKAFRNEISPRAGLIRVREFDMAEIEYFVHPERKATFSKFSSISSLPVTLYSACDQMEGKSPRQLTLQEAVKSGVIANETLAYFLGRIQLFLMKVGVAPDKLRFRQHMSNEMAHYAKDCWDGECHTSYGWLECVGCADRSCYDLTQHSKAANVDLCVQETLPQPRTEEVVEVVPDKGLVGKQFRKEAKPLMEWLSKLGRTQAEDLEKQLQDNGAADVEVAGKSYTLQANMLKIKHAQKTVHVAKVVPSVIEPSFGIGRVLYAILEHSFKVRQGDEKRVWLSLPPAMAPISCSVLLISSNEEFSPFIAKTVEVLKRRGITHRIDDSAVSIGRRYARTDEVGIPFGVTIDFDTLKNSTVTLRERNSTRQVRIKIDDVANTVADLVAGHMTWDEVEQNFPLFTAQESTQT